MTLKLRLLLKAFRGPAGKSLLKQLYSRRITNPSQVLTLICFCPLPATSDSPDGNFGQHTFDIEGARLDRLPDSFMKHFSRYLNGVGHPDHPLYNELISPEKREDAKKVPFRAHQFVYHMTGTTFLNPNTLRLEVWAPWLLRIQFSDNLMEIRFVRSFPNEHRRPADAAFDWKVRNSKFETLDIVLIDSLDPAAT